MANYQDPLSPSFHALADATRRAVLVRLAEGEMPVGQLAEPFGLALPTFLQHLKVLESAGLIVTEKRGRTRFCRTSPAPLDAAGSWLRLQAERMHAHTDRLEAFLQGSGDLDA